MMIGSYNSEKQSISDTNYFNISLHMYPIWQETGKSWLYVEQALNSMQDKPYRQRIYLVEEQEDGIFKSTVFSIAYDSLFIGKWSEPEFFDRFDENILKEREGCAVFMKREGDSFTGSTKDQACVSTLRGASYATSEVTVTEAGVESWDRGFDSDGNQVWGAENGPYIFDKLSEIK